MSTVPRLSEAVQKQILRRARTLRWSDAAMLRLRAVIAVAAGRSRRMVASVMSMAASTVVRAVERFAEAGFEGLADGRAANGARKVCDDYLEHLRAVVDHRAEDFGWQ